MPGARWIGFNKTSSTSAGTSTRATTAGHTSIGGAWMIVGSSLMARRSLGRLNVNSL